MKVEQVMPKQRTAGDAFRIQCDLGVKVVHDKYGKRATQW
jgi:hypothetical protein